jgi:hypothetical protein
MAVAVAVVGAKAIAKTSSYMASFNFDWHENDEETPKWINSSAMLINLDSPLLRAAASALYVLHRVTNTRDRAISPNNAAWCLQCSHFLAGTFFKNVIVSLG